MSQATTIEWTDKSWNFLRGCSRVSEGCRNCYAERQAARFQKPGEAYYGLVTSVANLVPPRWTGEIDFHENILLEPLRWRKPCRVFVNSMSDLFHEKVQDEWLDKAFAVMALTPQHTYQILTKRPKRMREYITTPFVSNRVFDQMHKLTPEVACWSWPTWRDAMKNVWLGVSVEDQKTADERIPLLLQTPAAVRWISAEPLLSPIDFQAVPTDYPRYNDAPDLDWVVVGGESGPNARLCDVAWIRSIVGQCKAAGVPVFVKQIGAKPCLQGCSDTLGNQERIALSLTDKKGGDMSEWPEDLRIREFPQMEEK